MVVVIILDSSNTPPAVVVLATTCTPYIPCVPLLTFTSIIADSLAFNVTGVLFSELFALAGVKALKL